MELYVTEVEPKPVEDRGVFLKDLPLGSFARLADDPECVVLKTKTNSCLIVVNTTENFSAYESCLNGWRDSAHMRVIPLKKGEAIAVGGE